MVSIKACGCTLERWMQLIHHTRLSVLCGDDADTFAALCLGADGAIAASAHVFTRWQARMAECLAEQRLHEARRIAVALDPLIRLLFAEPNPAPLKALVAQLGECRDSVRAPFTPASEALRAKLWDAHQSLAAGLESLTQ